VAAYHLLSTVTRHLGEAAVDVLDHPGGIGQHRDTGALLQGLSLAHDEHLARLILGDVLHHAHPTQKAPLGIALELAHFAQPAHPAALKDAILDVVTRSG